MTEYNYVIKVSKEKDNFHYQYTWKRMLHRKDGPADICGDDQVYYWAGLKHRLDGPAAIYASGAQEYYNTGLRHREDGPAVIYADGSEEYYIKGVLHRKDGPAQILADGTKRWWYKGKNVPVTNQKDFERYIKLKSMWM